MDGVEERERREAAEILGSWGGREEGRGRRSRLQRRVVIIIIIITIIISSKAGRKERKKKKKKKKKKKTDFCVFEPRGKGKVSSHCCCRLQVFKLSFLFLSSQTQYMENIALGVLLFLGLSFAPLISSNSEGDALHAFRRSLSDPDNVLQSWDPTLVNPCTWFHVTCNEDNAVTRVDLGNSKLSGHLVPELAQLQHLQYLELYKNDITGSIPEEFGNLKNLISLDLYSNNITGSIPESLGNLKSLVFLRLNNNRLRGQIPRSLTSISSLKVLDLSSNDLCGTIPVTGPFEHFPMKSFENNPRLDGPELLGSVSYDSGCR